MSITRQQRLFAILAFGPILLAFLVIRVIPILSTLGLSLTNFSFRRPITRFVGLENFMDLLGDVQFRLALVNTLEFLVLSVPLVLLAGLTFALLINRSKLPGLYQTLYFLPFILPTVPAAMIWRWIMGPGDSGLANQFLGRFGLPSVGWLTTPQMAILSIVLIYLWKNAGYYVVVFLVGLKSIAKELREAAAVDGATPWQVVTKIELPLLRPVVLFSAVMATISAMTVFTLVYVLAEGSDQSAGTQITVLAVRVYQEGFQYAKMGYASAISAVLFVLCLFAVVVQFKWLGRESH